MRLELTDINYNVIVVEVNNLVSAVLLTNSNKNGYNT